MTHFNLGSGEQGEIIDLEEGKKKKKKKETAMQKSSSYKMEVSAHDIVEWRSDKNEGSHE